MIKSFRALLFGLAFWCIGQIASAQNCTGPMTVTIAGSTTGLPLGASVSGATNPLCGGQLGSVNLTITGGSPSYMVYWTIDGGPLDSAQTALNNFSINGTTGTYAITVVDSFGCTVGNLTASLSAPPTLLASVANLTPITCNGANTGSVEVTSGGGTPGYTYLWNNGQTNTVLTGLTAGTYTVTVSDAGGCTATASSVLLQPAVLSASITLSAAGPFAIACHGACDGTAVVAGVGGTAPYTYLWGNGATVDSLGGLCAGIVSVTITDAAGCTAVAFRIVTEPPALNINVGASSNCAGLPLSLTASATGGGAPFGYSWSGPNNFTANIPNPTVTASATPANNGTYVLTVTDVNGCTQTDSIVVSLNPQPTVVLIANADTVTTPSICNVFSGITLQATGGTSYLWSTGSTTDTISIAGTAPTTLFTVTVTNALGCSITASVNVFALGTPQCPYPPNAVNDINASLDGDPVTGNLSTNDEDPQGAPLTYSLLPGSETNGTVNIASNGTYTFDPSCTAPCVGTFCYVACNPFGYCDTACVTIEVTSNGPFNDAPVASDDVAQTYDTTPVFGTVLNNDFDPDSDTLNVALVNTTQNGILLFFPDGTFGYQPNCVAPCMDSFTYVLCDNGTPPVCDTATVYIYVYQDLNGPSNDPPFAQDDAGAALADHPVTGNLLTNDFDANGDTLTINTTVVSGPGQPGATVVILPDGSYTYTPAPGFSGTDQFTYSICDSGNPALCDTATVYIVIYNCTLSATVAVAMNYNGSHITCFNACDGSIATTYAGGIDGYSFAWNTGQTDQDLTGLCAGMYVLTVTDGFGCSVVDSVAIVPPAPVVAVAVPTPDACFVPGGGGTIAVTASGGVAQYNVSWSGPESGDPAGVEIPSLAGTYVITGLTQGVYTVNVVDANGCDTSVVVTIDSSATGLPLSVVSLTSGNATCVPGAGAIDLEVGGGTPGYTYQWSRNGEITQDLDNAYPGVYSVTISDAAGCVLSDSVLVLPCHSDTLVPLQVTTTVVFCVDTTDISYNGNVSSIDLIPCGNVVLADTFSMDSLGCITYVAGSTTGIDTICVVVCDDLGLCDTTTVFFWVFDFPPVAIDDTDSIPSNGNVTSVTIDVCANDFGGGAIDSLQVIEYPTLGTISPDNDCVITYTYDGPLCNDDFPVDSFTYMVWNTGGADTAVVYIWVRCGDVEIFNGFSPNNDGMNDYFYINHIESYPLSELKLYNRWGNLVYEVVNYQNDWAGTFNGNALPDGTYFYILHLNDDEGQEFSGYLEIRR